MSEQEGDLITEKRKTRVVISDELKEELLSKLREEKTKEEKELEALSYFDRIKKELNEKYNTEDFNSCNTPKELGQLLEMLEIEKREKLTQKKAPSGKSTITSVSGSGDMRTEFTREDIDGGAEMIKELYRVGYYAPSNEVTVQERARAKKKISQLFMSIIQNPQKHQYAPSKEVFADVTQCPDCGTIMDLKTSSMCPNCKWDFFKKRGK